LAKEATMAGPLEVNWVNGRLYFSLNNWLSNSLLFFFVSHRRSKARREDKKGTSRPKNLMPKTKPVSRKKDYHLVADSSQKSVKLTFGHGCMITRIILNIYLAFLLFFRIYFFSKIYLNSNQ
jgi:hypothetical protein